MTSDTKKSRFICEFLDIYGGAIIVGVVADHDVSDWISKIIVEKDGKRYEILAANWTDLSCIEIEEVN